LQDRSAAGLLGHHTKHPQDLTFVVQPMQLQAQAGGVGWCYTSALPQYRCGHAAAQGFLPAWSRPVSSHGIRPSTPPMSAARHGEEEKVEVGRDSCGQERRHDCGGQTEAD
jgi:hypothetical protein